MLRKYAIIALVFLGLISLVQSAGYVKTLNYYKGVDISSIISVEESGVRFYDNYGRGQDIFRTLVDNGVNCIRVRVWNNPRSNNGKSYGGGNNDLETAKKIGQRAARYGLPLLVDFHYSDFWADPGKQTPPKAWSNYNLNQKSKAIYDYTYSSLRYLLDNNCIISMVQVGNENNCFMCGEKKMWDVASLMASGANAVHDVDRNIKVVLHFTSPDNAANMKWYASQLASARVNYDVFATSYYPYWHGTLSNLWNVLNEIATTYNKKVLVAETSYPYTEAAMTDDRCHYGKITSQANGVTFRYPISISGQKQAIKEVFNTIRNINGGIGVFYWEPAWISPWCRSDYERKQIWEQYGSSWASKTAAEYDNSASRTETGGTSWDNQALFDQNGKPLSSLSVFREV